jgi:hypothetical protein
MLRSPSGGSGRGRRQGDLHQPLGDLGDEDRREDEDDELPPNPNRNSRSPESTILDNRTLETLVELMQEVREKLSKLEARADEHDAQLQHINANFIRIMSPPHPDVNRPQSPRRRQQQSLPPQDTRRNPRFNTASLEDDIFG